MFTENEITEIERYSRKSTVIKKLYDEYLTYQQDATKIFYTSLTEAIIQISHDIRNKQLDAEDAHTKCMIKLAESGDKIFNTLARGKADVNGESAEKGAESKEKENYFTKFERENKPRI